MEIKREFFDVEQNTEEWLNLRLGKFTASTFSDLFAKPDTISYKKAIDKIVYERITGEAYAGYSYSNSRMEAGHELELLAKEHYEMQTFDTILDGGFYQLNNWVACSPDGRISNNGIVEFKSRDPHIYFEFIEKGALPSINKWQVYGQLYVTGADFVDYMPYCNPNLKTLILRIYPDNEIFKQLELKLEECIEIVKSRINKFKA